MRRALAGIALSLMCAACAGNGSAPSTSSASTTSTLPTTTRDPATTTAPTSTTAAPAGPVDPDFVIRLAVPVRVDMRSNPFAPPGDGRFPEAFGAQLYRVLPANGALIPQLAEPDEPPAGEPHPDGWSIQVLLNEGPTWSDGEPIVAFDVEYTFEDLQRFGEPADLGWAVEDPTGRADLVSVDALDRRTVEFRFSARPDLDRWQYGIATATILPEHYWVFTFSDRVPGRERDADLGMDAPSAGAYRFGRTAGGIWSWEAVEGWWDSGARYSVYANGAVAYRNERTGVDEVYGGPPEGTVVSTWEEGPYAGRVEWRPVESPERSVTEGDEDLHAGSGEARPSRLLTAAVFGTHREIVRTDAGRRALACFFFAAEMAGVVSTAATPATDGWGTGWWHEGNSTDPCPGTGRQRLAEGVRLLGELGWTWVTPPAWDGPGSVAPGDGLADISGAPAGLRVLAPAGSSDPVAAEAAQWIVSWLTGAGFDVSFRDGDLEDADPGDFDVAVTTMHIGEPPHPRVPLDPAIAERYLGAGTVDAARVAWRLASERIREEALAVPLLWPTLPGGAPNGLLLPYSPAAGSIDLARIVSAVRRP